MKNPRSFLEQISFAFSLVCLGTLVAGTKACQEDYSLGTQISVTPSATATETPDGTEIASLTQTPGTATPGPTETPDPTETPEPTVGLNAAFFRSLETLGESPTPKAAPTVVAPDGAVAAAGTSSDVGNWLGNAFKKDGSQIGGSAAALDSDRDGFTDQYEVEFGTDPFDRTAFPPGPTTRTSDRLRGVDSDMDGVSDSDESKMGLNSNARDSDRDGCPDGAEVLSGSDPRDPNSRPAEDADGDCLSSEYETSVGTNPGNPDSDGDGLRDDFELALSADPLNGDSDGDGILDGKEFSMGGDPARSDPRE